MTSWRRVAFPRLPNVVLTVFALIGSCAVVALALAQFTDWIAWEGAGLPGLAFMVVWTALAWRMRIMGLYVSDHGVRIRGHLTTRTFPWQDIKGFDVRPFEGITMTQVQAVWVVTKVGRAHRTLLWFRPNDEPRDRVTPVLLPEQRFQETLTELRGMLERSRQAA
jgi:hypothetical protein